MKKLPDVKLLEYARDAARTSSAALADAITRLMRESRTTRVQSPGILGLSKRALLGYALEGARARLRYVQREAWKASPGYAERVREEARGHVANLEARIALADRYAAAPNPPDPRRRGTISKI